MTEDRFLHQLFPRLGAMPAEVVVGPGDDCAAVRARPGRLLLLAVDQVVGDRHYRLAGPDADPPALAGRKLLARNLSDIAAMGGVPLHALVAATLGPGQDEAWLNAFFDGMLELARATGVTLIGGDLARAPHDTVASLTITGEVADAEIKLRSGARPGDIFLATGGFGNSFPTRHHLTFTPRLREGRLLARHPGVHAMMDVSDGLFLDASRICRASNVTLRLDPARIPLRTPQTTIAQALGDGEDYELILAADPVTAAALEQTWPFPDVPLTRLGEFRAPDAAGPQVTGPRGEPLQPGHAGFDHFQE